jgi:hypothetical protein
MTQTIFSKTLLGATVAGMAMFASTSFAAPMDSIADSWHNLGSLNKKSATPSGNTPANHSNATAEICVFCHTPHGGDNNASVPIWNRQLNSPTAYTRYGSLGSSTFDADEDDIGSVTIACLSCHDGGQAIDSVINAPGSGGFVNKDNFTYGNMPRLGGGDMVGGDLDTATGRLLTPAQGIVQNLETDLSNDHPVSMQYAGGGITANAGTWTGQSRDPDFAGSGRKTHPGQDANGATISVTAMAQLSTNPNAKFANLFWLERSDSLAQNERDREDIIFYTRNWQGQEQPFVECGSCHDPHNVDNPTFLRTSNGIPTTLANDFPLAQNDAASGLCLTCHIK